MMKSNLIWIVLFISSFVSGQSKWEVFVPFDNIEELEFNDNLIYLRSNKQLIKIDRSDDSQEVIVTDESGYRAFENTDIELIKNETLWVATRSDLFAYSDGRFEKFDLGQGDNPTVARLSSKDNLLTVAHIGQNDSVYVSTIEDDSITFQKAFDLGFNAVLNIDIDNHIWISAENKLINAITLDEIEIPIIDSLEGTQFVHYTDSNAHHWLYARYSQSSSEYVVWKYDYQEWTKYEVPHTVSSFHEPNPGEVLFSTWKYLGHLLDDGEVLLEELSTKYGHIPSYNDVLYIGPEFDWISASNYRGDEKLYQVRADDYDSYYTTDLSFDRFGEHGVDCNGNIFMLDKFAVLHRYNDVQWDTVDINYFNEECKVQFFEYDKYRCQTWAYNGDSQCQSIWKLGDDIREIDIFSDDLVSDITFDPDGSVYFSTNREVYKIDTLGITTLLGNSKPSIVDISYGIDTSIWVAAFHGVHQYQDGVWTRHDFDNNQNVESTWVYADNLGNIWYWSSLGLFKYDGEEWNSIGLSIYNVYDMVQVGESNYWLATSYGLVEWNEFTINRYEYKDVGILSSVCLDLTIIGDSTLWITHPEGISKMKIDNFPSATEEAKNPNTTPAQFSLYPNPTESGFTLSFPHIENRKIEIFNTAGQLIDTIETSAESLEVSSLMSSVFKAGCYWVRVTGPSGRAVEKVVVY